MNKNNLVAINIIAAVLCAVSAVMQFSVGAIIPGAMMASLTLFNILFAIVNFKE